MAKSMFSIGASWKPKRQTIREISVDLMNILIALSETDDLFSKPIFSKENHVDVMIPINEMPEVTVVEIISSTILDFSRSDILLHEKEDMLTIDYSRDFGFSLVVCYKQNNEDVISFIPRLGSIQANGIGTLSFSKYFEKSFSWYQDVLKAIIVSSNAVVGLVGLRETPFNKACKNIIAPLGWITYFSKEFKPYIPDDLEGIEYEYTDKGKYLILTHEDFTKDKETYDAHKERLLLLMEEIKQRVPEYSK